MSEQRRIKKAAFTIEYAVLIIILVLAFFLSRTYIIRASSGYWRQLGDTFGFGRQYEKGVTTITITP